MSRTLALVAGLAIAMPAAAQVCTPEILGVIDATDAVAVRVFEDTAYIADFDGKLITCDVRHPESPVPMAEFTGAGHIGSLDVYGSYVYTASFGPGSLEIIDVSRPWAPALLASLPLDVNQVEVEDGLLYVTTLEAGASTLRVFDLTIPDAPVEIGAALLPFEPVRMTVEGRYAYVTLNDQLDGELAIVDLDDPANPAVVSMLPLPNDPLGIDVEDGIAVIGGWTQFDLAIVDVTDPLLPTLLGVHPIGHPGPDVAIKAGKAFIAGEGAGLSIFDIRDPLLPTLIGSLPVPGIAYGLDLNGSDLYLADRDIGVLGIDAWSCLACTPADQSDPFLVLSGQDVGDFAYGFINGHPHADIDGDGLFELDDVMDFIDLFMGGCP